MEKRMKDSLTKGWTFGRFAKEASFALGEKPGKKAALVTMDINQFKLINDLFGYESGNEVIRRLHMVWNELLIKPECWARHGADCFVALMFYESREELEKRLDYVTDKIGKIDILSFKLCPSFGIYEIADRSLKISAMHNLAEMAKATIKGRQDKCIRFFDASMREDMLYRKRLEDEMEKALLDEEFQVVYQPQFDGVKKRVVGAEALVRWIKKDGTVISPQDFIPVFEKDGLIVKLDSYMFRKVCQKQEEWLERIGHVVPVSVNLSKRHLYKGDFLSEYRQILSEYTIVPEAIKLEITEGTMAEQKEHMQEMIDHLHQMGLKILMDDFGTGYASFGMLKSLDIDVLKLDKSLVDDIGDSKGEEILKSIIKLAYALGMDVVAEGVEKKEQLDFLLQCDCRVIQGYYFSKPLCEEEFEKLLES